MTERVKEPLSPKAPPIKKVFCRDCKYFKTFRGVLGNYREWCMACSTHRAPAESYEGAPEEINKDNTCSMFESGKGKHVDLL